jgi:hypothetical protein
MGTMRRMKTETWVGGSIIAALLLSVGLLLASAKDEYRDRITCEHFKAEGVMVQEQEVHFHVYYADGRRAAVSGVCVAEFGVIAEAAETQAGR